MTEEVNRRNSLRAKALAGDARGIPYKEEKGKAVERILSKDGRREKERKGEGKSIPEQQ